MEMGDLFSKLESTTAGKELSNSSRSGSIQNLTVNSNTCSEKGISGSSVITEGKVTTLAPQRSHPTYRLIGINKQKTGIIASVPRNGNNVMQVRSGGGLRRSRQIASSTTGALSSSHHSQKFQQNTNSKTVDSLNHSFKNIDVKKHSNSTPKLNVSKIKGQSRGPINGGSSQPVKDKSKFLNIKFGYRKIDMMVKEKDCDEIVLYICQNADIFELLLMEELRPDLLGLLVKLIVKIIDTKFPESKSHVYSMICEKKFMDYLASYVTGLADTISSNKIQAHYELLNGLHVFLNDLIDTLPNKAIDSVEKVVSRCKMVTKELSSVDSKFEVLATGYEDLKSNVSLVKQRWEEKMKENKSHRPKLELAPPNDFREISIYPTAQDLKERNFLRENKIEGSYLDVHDYLDVQFRLLREDFIDPLRLGIKIYRESILPSNSNEKRKKNFNIRIYRNVVFLGNEYDQKKLGQLMFTVQIDPKFASKIRWEYSKRFLFNSLCLFSNNDFESFFLATVADRNIKLLETGKLSVVLVGSGPSDPDLFNKKFVMAESSAFFDPVYQTLSTLQMLPTDALPMENYILVKNIDRKLPEYLIGKSAIQIKQNMITIHDDISWLKCLKLGFNQSQCDALKAAIRNEFCVIQGPPGTGKTYLGINLVKILLENMHFDNPILMVCYTNHALDQFLEGLMPVTENIVRIGGQSKNEALLKFNFKNLRMSTRQHSNPALKQLKEKMTKCLIKLASLNNVLKGIQKCTGIIDILKYERDCKLDNLNSFDDGDDYLQWLLGSDKYHLLKSVKIKYCFKKTEESSNGDNKSGNDESIDEEYSDDEEDYRRRGLINEFEDIEELAEIKVQDDVPYLLTVQFLELALGRMKQSLFRLNSEGAADYKKKVLLDEIDQTMMITNFIINKLQDTELKPSTKFSNLLKKSLWNCSERDRWALYHYWIRSIKQVQTSLINQEHETYSESLNAFNEFKSLDDFAAIKDLNPKILGLTTTGAARHHNLLCAVKPSVIVVEEAAEVLEAHIIVSLTKSCKHLILIGDHKQLRPNPSTFKLAKDYNLDISFFERMLRNGVGCSTLNVQHRMKPNIASLIAPLIYPDLKNHDSVEDFPMVHGVVKNLFFVNHKVFENQDSDMEESHRNDHEAEFLIALCRYLLLQGYNPEDITILTTYSGQQFYLRDLKKRHGLLRNVRMTVVDNYQGEESKIILLSLVRSNEEGSIGFLGTENRICVALSRAKHGLYIIGNMDILKSKSDMWLSINGVLERDGAIGESLPLVCQIHNIVTPVNKAKDFQLVVEGGCSNLCNTMRPCGHICTSLCHPIDRAEHLTYKCTKPCLREICNDPGHACPLKCYEICRECKIPVERLLKCNHKATMPCCENPAVFKCKVLVDDVKGDCKHQVQRECYKNIDLVKCPVPCNIRLDCGHACAKTCHINDDPDHLEYKCWKDCTKLNANCKLEHPCQRRCFEECKDCLVLVKRTLSCGHTHKIACSVAIETFKCERDCSRTLECGHKCRKKCFEPCGGCKEKVDKVIPDCGHTWFGECSAPVDRSMCRKACERTLSCGHPCKLKCSADCNLCKCLETVPSPVYPICGHPGRVICSSVNKLMDPTDDLLLSYCREPCKQKLPCGDFCRGTCGLCMQGRIHQACQEKCGNVLICGHTCSVPCREDCPPCKEKCLYKCQHSRCIRDCGVPCVSCKEKCLWACKHLRCTKLCGEECDREPCYEPCDSSLPCGHPCVGFCGEPCPPLCRVCNQEELTEILFGTEGDEDARFVLLHDCKHTLESEGLEHWLNLTPENGKDEEIGVKGCPKCKTPITGTLRFSNASKKAFKQVQDVKQKIFGEVRTITKLRKSLEVEHLPKLKVLVSEAPDFVKNCQHLNEIICNAESVAKPGKQQRKFGGKSSLLLINFVLKYLIELTLSCSDMNLTTGSNEFYTFVRKYSLKIGMRYELLVLHLWRRHNKISLHEIQQFQLESMRFQRMTDFYFVLLECSHKLFTSNMKKCATDIIGSLLSTKPYDYDTQVLNKIEEFTKINDVFYQQVSADEMKAVHEAMMKDFTSPAKQGHWFKCSKGHIYVITECGGAMERGVCPECKEVIGGGSHALVTTSRLASEVDGAHHAAWSENMNMANFHF